ncbi:MAG TPA: polysaccharide ABC transporter ATP-binding protein [Flavobacterium sp.]|uniref:ABC transporter ATP-binding protein n=1 Tax=Flavobacterium sp. TaxID=239 RepID=UPI002D1B0E04|nr:polysaccharide ABC transporter ATP-binding protein [Flavobacterium sp.]HNP32724.1 polysaccharide ABC transporter ATP-binding protein [Flavobacterium sp.]
MNKPIIHVENLSKAYQIGQIGTGTISRDIERFWMTKILGKDDPFLKIGETNDRSIKGDSDIVWSLKDINFEINQGEAVGIIGKNGAGKSTLLKLLSRVTSPTTGEIKVKGRIASLLEVGTGFHPELSGKENIYLNGAILGMRKKEITRKLDEIIDFSGVERYIDTPVKRYSSGMYVRLAFAVAAHLESEILIVDEVLAVGDAEFQKKCLGKMSDISKGQGRTVLFVSHNMAAVKNLCTKGIVLENGLIKHSGDLEDSLSYYLKNNLQEDELSKIHFEDSPNKKTQILEVSIKDAEENLVSEYFTNQEIFIHVKLKNDFLEENLRLNFSLLDKFENVIFIKRRAINFVGINTWIIRIPKDILIANNYLIGLAIDVPKVKLLDFPAKKLNLKIVDIGQEEFKSGDVDNGFFKMPIEWEK